MNRTYFTLTLIISIFLLSGCAGRNHDTRLVEVAEIVSKSPKEALVLLDSINPESLSDADRHYYDFLTIKAKDKAYITHTSDSLALSVIDYYSKHRDDRLYPEAIYYGGRVYNDMGDYPTALKYYQNALDLLPEDTKHLRLRSHVLSQTSSLLRTLRLYKRAIPYVEKSIRVDSMLNDSLNLMFDLKLLGTINLHAENYEVAESKFKAARKLAERVSPEDIYQQDMYLAAIKYYHRDFDSALVLLRPVIPKIHPMGRNNAISYAADIYLRLNILDTAYIYANELITDKNSYNKEIGYQVMLSPKLKDYVPEDSLYSYISQYQNLLSKSLDKNEKQEALLQNSFYNYSLHEREREKAENIKGILQKWMTVIIMTLLVICIISLYLKYKNSKNLLQLHEALDDLAKLRIKLKEKDQQKGICTDSQQQSPDKTNTEIDEAKTLIHETQQELVARYKNDLLSLQQNNKSKKEISPKILNSEAYAKLQDHISKEKFLSESNPLWNQLEKAVISSSGNFKYNLQLLTGGNIKIIDYHLSLLIKCGVTPTQMTILVGKTKGGISYRREELCRKCFGSNLGAKVIDDIIRLL
ncbi:MAG: hypothetical protein J6A20_09335 [Muribaculaceae bacterium]|nr:hypothetical protein [Muribaculaceae bacterium]